MSVSIDFITDTAAIEEILRHEAVFSDASTYVINNGVVDVNGSVTLRDAVNSRREHLPIQFGTITGNFSIGTCDYSATLHGCPNWVGGVFDCSNLAITDLTGGPQHVGGRYLAQKCEQLLTTDGLAHFIGDGLYLHNCTKLHTMTTIPTELTVLSIAKTPALTQALTLPDRIYKLSTGQTAWTIPACLSSVYFDHNTPLPPRDWLQQLITSPNIKVITTFRNHTGSATANWLKLFENYEFDRDYLTLIAGLEKIYGCALDIRLPPAGYTEDFTL